jgi:hypothetical protein
MSKQNDGIRPLKHVAEIPLVIVQAISRLQAFIAASGTGTLTVDEFETLPQVAASLGSILEYLVKDKPDLAMLANLTPDPRVDTICTRES